MMPEPVSAMDVAAYILQKQGQMTTWKLQKLCFLLTSVVFGMG